MTSATEMKKSKDTFNSEVQSIIATMGKEDITKFGKLNSAEKISGSKETFAKNRKDTANYIAKLYKRNKNLSSAMKELAPAANQDLSLL